MLVEGRRLIEQRRQRVGDVQPPQDREGHPAAARFTGDGAHHRDARHVKQHEDQVAVGGNAGAEFAAHHAHRADAHLTVALAGFDRVGQHAQAEGVFQAVPGFLQCAAQFIEQVEVGGVERLFVDVLGGIQRIQRADHHFFRHRAGHQPNGGLPVIAVDAHRLQQRRQYLGDRGQRGVVDVVDRFAAEREAVQAADEYAGHHDHLTGAQHEAFQPLPGLQQQAFQVRHVVNRQLHDERRGFAAHEGIFEYQAGQDRHRDAEHVQREHHPSAVLAEEGGGEHREDRQTGAAGHERRHHDGDQALALGVQRTGAHDGRHVATEADDQRHEGFARQPERLHQAIHHERRARHVAGVFQER